MKSERYIRVCSVPQCQRPLRWRLTALGSERATCPEHGEADGWAVVDVQTGAVVAWALLAEASAARPPKAA